MKILVVDDDPVLRKGTVRLLKKAGYTVLDVDNGTKALEVTAADQPDVILLDVHLPDINGMEVCRGIRSSTTLYRPCIVMLSSMHRRSEDLVKGLESGADGYIVRPIPNNELLARVNAMVRLKRAEDENRRLAIKVHEAKKYEAMGTMSRGIAHDYNNLLMVITGGLSLLEEDLAALGKIPKTLETVSKACGKATELTEKFLTLSRCGSSAGSLFSVEDLVDKAVKSLEQDIGISYDITMVPDLLSVRVDGQQVSHALECICRNAAEAMGGEGVVLIHGENQTRETLSTLPEDNDGEGARVVIYIRDTGVGIAPDAIPYLFDPYYSTKTVGTQKGMGMGLAMARSYIVCNGGDIYIESLEGEGTTATVWLPAVAE